MEGSRRAQRVLVHCPAPPQRLYRGAYLFWGVATAEQLLRYVAYVGLVLCALLIAHRRNIGLAALYLVCGTHGELHKCAHLLHPFP